MKTGCPRWWCKMLYIALSAVFFALCSSADAQQMAKVFRIGFLDGSTASGLAELLDAFRQELNKLGWIDGKNITIESRFGEQNNERLPELAAELVRLKIDLILVTGPPPALTTGISCFATLLLNGPTIDITWALFWRSVTSCCAMFASIPLWPS